MLAGVLTQVLSGWYDFEPALYLQILRNIPAESLQACTESVARDSPEAENTFTFE